MDAASHDACAHCAGGNPTHLAADGIGRRSFIALVSISTATFAVVRTGDTSFVTLSRVSPHEGNIVNPNGSGFLCPGHGARFSANGTWVGGERTSSLRSYATSYDATEGTITIG